MKFSVEIITVDDQVVAFSNHLTADELVVFLKTLVLTKGYLFTVHQILEGDDK